MAEITSTMDLFLFSISFNQFVKPPRCLYLLTVSCCLAFRTALSFADALAVLVNYSPPTIAVDTVVERNLHSLHVQFIYERLYNEQLLDMLLPLLSDLFNITEFQVRMGLRCLWTEGMQALYTHASLFNRYFGYAGSTRGAALVYRQSFLHH